MPESPFTNLIDALDAAKGERDAAQADRRTLYEAIISRSAAPQDGDGATLLALIDELRLNPSDARAAARRVIDDAAAVAKRADLERRNQELAAQLADLEAQRSEATATVGTLAEQTAVARDQLKAVEVPEADKAKLLAIEAAITLTAGRADVARCYLRARGWKLMQGGWRDPQDEKNCHVAGPAVQIQIKRDLTPFLAGVCQSLHAQHDRALAITTMPPRPAALHLPALPYSVV